MTYPKEIIEFIQNPDELNLEKKDSVAIVSVKDLSILELVKDASDNIFFISDNKTLTASVITDFTNIKVIDANEENTMLENKSIDYIFLDYSVNNFNIKKTRQEFNRILKNCWNDVIIFESKETLIDSSVKDELFAGSWYEEREFDSVPKITLYYNPLGLSLDEFEAKEIVEFKNACENYCNVIENYNKYSVKEFLYEAHKYLTEYYYKGFFLPDSYGTDKRMPRNEHEEFRKEMLDVFFKTLNLLVTFLGSHDTYMSNFSPYPEADDHIIYNQSLSLDLGEIYEDLKSDLIIYNVGDIYKMQDILWHWKFNWADHTGDHVTFAFRAIHWKLQELQYEDDKETNE